MAVEVLEPRWTMLILRELCLGSSRFNEIRRGVPRMSPTLLSKRLRELEENGIISRSVHTHNKLLIEYQLTPSGHDFINVIMEVGNWGKKWIDSKDSLQNTDVELLMWDIRRNLHAEHFPLTFGVVQLHLTDAVARHCNWWVIFAPGAEPDLGPIEPPEEVNLFIETDTLTLTEIWLGYKSIEKACEVKALQLLGPQSLIKSVPNWLGPSAFANIESLNNR